VANLPAPISPSPLPEDNRTYQNIIDSLERGEMPAEIARRVEPTDKRARGRIRRKIHRMARTDIHFQRAIAERAKANFILGLPAMSVAMTRRASRGRVDAAKFIGEASGFHNPKVQHEHSGEVTIKLDLPRPTFTDPGASQVVDAEVVDE
jgi:hypothetical protein